MRRSLFDSHISGSMEANLEYMWKRFGFYFPEADLLADPEGLLMYLVSCPSPENALPCSLELFASCFAPYRPGALIRPLPPVKRTQYTLKWLWCPSHHNIMGVHGGGFCPQAELSTTPCVAGG